MKFFKHLITLVILLSFSLIINAQDQIILKTKKVIQCKIVEVGVTDIKYKLVEKRQDLTFSIEKYKVKKIIFSDGEVMDVSTNEFYNKDNYSDDKPNAIKANFLSPLFGSFQMSFEHSIKPGMSLEGNFGIIGLGTDLSDVNPAGACIGFGIKFIASPDFYMERMRYAHILNGIYINPNIQFSVFSLDKVVYLSQPLPNGENYQKVRVGQSGGALLISVGRQWVFSNVFVVDFNTGFGYGFTNQSDIASTSYNFSSLSNELPIAWSSNFRIGFLIKGKETTLKDE